MNGKNGMIHMVDCYVCDRRMQEDSFLHHIRSRKHCKLLHDAQRLAKYWIKVTGSPSVFLKEDIIRSIFEKQGKIQRVVSQKDAFFIRFLKVKNASLALDVRHCNLKNNFNLNLKVMPVYVHAHRPLEVDVFQVEPENNALDDFRHILSNTIQSIQSSPFLSFETIANQLVSSILSYAQNESGSSLVYRELTNMFSGWVAALQRDHRLRVNVRVYVFGSIEIGLSLSRFSDIDIYIDVGSSCVDMLHETTALLFQNSDKFHDILSIRGARVPIVKAVHSETDIPIDISFKSKLGWYNSQLIKFYVKYDPRVRTLLAIIKIWFKRNELNDTRAFTSYSIYWLGLFYLQQLSPPLIPSVHQLLQFFPSTDCLGWKVIHSEEMQRVEKVYPPSKNTMSLEKLLLGFFRYYPTLDLRDSVICPLLGKVLPRRVFEPENLYHLPREMDMYYRYAHEFPKDTLKISSQVCIQDPYDLSHNITKAVTHASLSLLQHHIDTVWVLHRHCPVRLLLSLLEDKNPERDSRLENFDAQNENLRLQRLLAACEERRKAREKRENETGVSKGGKDSPGKQKGEQSPAKRGARKQELSLLEDKNPERDTRQENLDAQNENLRLQRLLAACEEKRKAREKQENETGVSKGGKDSPGKQKGEQSPAKRGARKQEEGRKSPERGRRTLVITNSKHSSQDSDSSPEPADRLTPSEDLKTDKRVPLYTCGVITGAAPSERSPFSHKNSSKLVDSSSSVDNRHSTAKSKVQPHQNSNNMNRPPEHTSDKSATGLVNGSGPRDHHRGPLLPTPSTTTACSNPLLQMFSNLAMSASLNTLSNSSIPNAALGNHVPNGPLGNQVPKGPLGNQVPNGPLSNQVPNGPLGNQVPNGPLGNQVPNCPLGNQVPNGPLGSSPLGVRGFSGSSSSIGSPQSSTSSSSVVETLQRLAFHSPQNKLNVNNINVKNVAVIENRLLCNINNNSPTNSGSSGKSNLTKSTNLNQAPNPDLNIESKLQNLKQMITTMQGQSGGIVVLRKLDALSCIDVSDLEMNLRKPQDSTEHSKPVSNSNKPTGISNKTGNKQLNPNISSKNNKTKEIPSQTQINKTKEIPIQTQINKTKEIPIQTQINKTKEIPIQTQINKTKEITSQTQMNKTKEIPRQTEINKTKEIPIKTQINKTKEIPIQTQINKTKEIPIKTQINKTKEIPIQTQINKTKEIPIKTQINKTKEIPIKTQINKTKEIPIKTQINKTKEIPIKTQINKTKEIPIQTQINKTKASETNPAPLVNGLHKLKKVPGACETSKDCPRPLKSLPSKDLTYVIEKNSVDKKRLTLIVIHAPRDDRGFFRKVNEVLVEYLEQVCRLEVYSKAYNTDNEFLLRGNHRVDVCHNRKKLLKEAGFNPPRAINHSKFQIEIMKSNFLLINARESLHKSHFVVSLGSRLVATQSGDSQVLLSLVNENSKEDTSQYLSFVGFIQNGFEMIYREITARCHSPTRVNLIA